MIINPALSFAWKNIIILIFDIYIFDCYNGNIQYQTQKPKIYLETTLFNYYYLTDEARQNDIEATRRLFQQFNGKFFIPFTSALIVD